MSYFAAIDKEERLILVMALCILALLDNPKPRKISALRFIKSRELAKFYDDDFAPRSNGEEKWMNDFSWAREDLKESGLLSMPEVGVWQLTEKGHKWIVEKARRWVEIYEKNPTSKDDLLRRCRRLNETFFVHMIILGKGGDLRKKPNKAPEPTPTAAA